MDKKPQPYYLERYSKSLKWIVLAFGILLYANTLNHGMALDDYSIIVENAHVQAGTEGIGKILTTNYRNGQAGFNDGLYRPLSPLTFALEKEFFDSSTFIGHLINVLLFAFAGFFLFLALKRLLPQFPIVLPLAITLLFVAHPIHTEGVANIKGRDEVLAFFGMALALLSFCKYFLDQNKKAFWAGILAFLMALFSKESAVTFSLAIPVLLFLHPDIQWKKLIPLTATLLVLSIGFMGLRMYIVSSMPQAVDPGNFGLLNNPIAATDDAALRFGTAFRLQVFFLQKLLFPYPLIHDYSYNLIPLVNLWHPLSLLGVGLLAAYAFLVLKSGLKKNIIALAILFYLLTISVGSQLFITIGTTFAERLLFVPVLGFCMALAYLIWWLRFRERKVTPKQQQQFAYLLLIPILLYAAMTFQRNGDWKNNISLYSADIEHAANSARANYNYGSALMERSKVSRSTAPLQTAEKHFRQAIAIYPEYLDAYNNLGICYKMMGKPELAIPVYQQNIKIDPEYSKNYYNLATAYMENKQFAESIQSFESYVQLKPNSADAYYLMGQAAGNLQQFDRAIGYLNQAIAINPNYFDAYNFLGMAYGFTGQRQQAEQSFLTANRIRPNEIQPLLNLAIHYHQNGALEKEVSMLQKVLSLQANHRQALQQLVTTLQLLGRNDEAAAYQKRL